MANAAELYIDVDSSGVVQAIRDLGRLIKATDQAGREADSLAAKQRAASTAAAREAREVDRLSAKFVENYTMNKRRAASYADVDAAFNRGIISAQQYAIEVSRIDDAFMTIEAGAARSVAAMATMDRSMSTSSHHSTNLMFQLQDIGMMMAAGQNPFMLMMQQGSQVSGVFSQMQAEGKKIGPAIAGAFTQLLNPMTAVTFAVIGGTAALTQWAMSAWGAESDADGLSEAIDGVTAAANATMSAIENSRLSAFELRMEYGALADAAKAAFESQVVLEGYNVESSVRGLGTQISAITSDLDVMVERYLDFSIAAEDANRSMQDQRAASELAEEAAANIAFEFGMTVEQAIALSDAVRDLAGANGLVDAQSKTAALVELFRGAKEEGALITAETLGLVTQLGNANQTMIALLANAQAFGTTLGAITVPLGPGMDYGNPTWFWGQTAGDLLPGPAGLASTPTPTPSGRRGGGGGGGMSEADRLRQDMERRLEALIDGFQTERQVIDSQYALDQETLKYALDNKLLIEEEYNQRRLQMNAAYEQELQSIRLAEYSAATSSMGDVFGQLAAIQGTNNEKLLRGQRTFAAASALISAYQGAAAALADPNITWIGRIAAYGSVLAAGLGAVAAIKGGGSSGSSRAATAPTTPATAKEPVKNVMVKLDGDKMFMDMAESLMQQIYRESENGRVIISRGQ